MGDSIRASPTRITAVLRMIPALVCFMYTLESYYCLVIRRKRLGLRTRRRCLDGHRLPELLDHKTVLVLREPGSGLSLVILPVVGATCQASRFLVPSKFLEYARQFNGPHDIRSN
ncbi:uncharacterized protein BT62DRAFT_999578 [Guyanagaster necrorhizus]|uniref:Uncharacterized protein n=1 Tax=Guyanagaster necrorhizus TaxID=856835 RepID=A0A9P7W473_9AGAR|nr:uncharacterized protein BT62DRAFT_999578 [Guyanagaster necrorhizus MCA 3950]KAG7451857.1 hypothetical protein BT62DRAFT_999578 [Guyanagaster necrorhizus MCA 3950]